MSRSRYSLPRFALLLATLLGSVASPFTALPAQELSWLEAGRVRLDFTPRFWGWDSRFGARLDGNTLVEGTETIGSDLTTIALGSDQIPYLRDLEASLREATGASGYRVVLGASKAVIDQSRIVFPFRLDVGVTDWLTVGANVPLVRRRSEILSLLDADSLKADVGVSPNLLQSGAVSSFLTGLQTAVDSAMVLEPGNETWTNAQSFLEALGAAYAHNSFFPVAGSGAGLVLQERLDGFRNALEALGFTGLPGTVPLAEGYLDTSTFQDFLTSQNTGMNAWPLEDWTTPWALGDVEVTASVRLLDGGFEPDSLGNLPLFRYQLGGGLLYRLGTGQKPDPNRFYDLAAGDGQADMEVGLFGMVQLGSWLGGWFHIRKGIQQEGEILRRIAAPSEPLPNWRRLAPLKWTPGSYTEVDVNPRLYLSPAMSFGVRYRHWSKGADDYALTDLSPEDIALLDYPPTELLEEETEQSLNELGFSATFSTLEAHARGEASIPLELRFTYLRPMSGSGGQTPNGDRLIAGISIFRRFWGGGRQAEEEVAPPGGLLR